MLAIGKTAVCGVSDTAKNCYFNPRSFSNS
jgi:hypothetical protein